MRIESDQKPRPSEAIHYVALAAFDGNGNITAPPERVLHVCVVNDRAFLSVCEYEEDGKTSTTTETAEVIVDTVALLAALVSQLDPNVAEAALRFGGVR